MRIAIDRRALFSAFGVILWSAAALGSGVLTHMTESMAAGPGSEIISARDAYDRAARGEIVLVDIRRPEEWMRTGVGEGAHAITMNQEPQTLFALLKDVSAGKPVALICATGGRTGYLKPFVEQAGIGPVLDVSEGMMGSEAGAGWLAEGLPTVAWSPITTTAEKSTLKVSE